MKETIREWPESRELFLVHEGEDREAPHAGELFRQPALAVTLEKLVAAEREALAAGASRKEAILAAYARFYTGDIARDFVAGSQALGGLHTVEDLANWKVGFEQPVTTRYRDLDVYKLTTWTQGPAMLQALNILEGFDLRALGYNSTRYIHTVYQAMSLAFADRDFYYGDPAFPPEEPVAGLLSKDYAAARRATIDHERNDPAVKPGDPYPHQRERNPFADQLKRWSNVANPKEGIMPPWQQAQVDLESHEQSFLAGTTSVQAADAEGWVVSVTPSGGWIPAVVAGTTGIGMSQRMQSFVLDADQNPFNVLEPGKRPRVTLTPGLALKDGKPYLSFAVQGGDIQDQVLLQFLLAVREFGMNVQEAVEAPHFWSFQMRDSFEDHRAVPGRILLNDQTPAWVRKELAAMGYAADYRDRTSGPINAIFFDQEQNAMQGGSSDFGEDYGIAW
jgi:gamma-glutamyltranspeptidase/glutathione hydrolase